MTDFYSIARAAMQHGVTQVTWTSGPLRGLKRFLYADQKEWQTLSMPLEAGSGAANAGAGETTQAADAGGAVAQGASQASALHANEAFFARLAPIERFAAEMERWPKHAEVPDAPGWEKTSAHLLRNGEEEALVERLFPKPRLFLFGAGHVGEAFSRILHELDFTQIVVDERPEFANSERFPYADAVHTQSAAEVLAAYPPLANDWYVIMTAGHKSDRTILEQVLTRPFAYIGMIGSKAKVVTVRKALLESGTDAALLDRVHAPIGIPIGAQTPAEIAISILAEMIQVLRSSQSLVLEESFWQALSSLKQQGKTAMMASIMEKRGSGPRDVGARMLVDAESKLLAGTVGGGAVEAESMRHAAAMLRSGDEFDVVWYDLSNREAATLGMVCGGRTRILFETVTPPADFAAAGEIEAASQGADHGDLAAPESTKAGDLAAPSSPEKRQEEQ